MDTVKNQNTGGITLKSLLADPFALLPKSDEKKEDKTISAGDDKNDEQKAKAKELELDYDPFGNINPMSAFLGPKLWDDSMLYGDNKELKFEFMDIDEFLNEHGILENNTTTHAEKEKSATDDDKSDDVDVVEHQAISPQDVISMSVGDESEPTAVTESFATTITLPNPPRTPSPVNINVDFELTHTDVALATIPGEDEYDPRSKQFNEEELKPQPMIKKSKKVFVPEEQKDGKYWERRRKNNIAAKRSRDARRVKENQIVLRAAYLEKLNGALKGEVVGLKKENMSLKSVVAKLEKELKEALEQQQSPLQL